MGARICSWGGAGWCCKEGGGKIKVNSGNNKIRSVAGCEGFCDKVFVWVCLWVNFGKMQMRQWWIGVTKNISLNGGGAEEEEQDNFKENLRNAGCSSSFAFKSWWVCKLTHSCVEWMTEGVQSKPQFLSNSIGGDSFRKNLKWTVIRKRVTGNYEKHFSMCGHHRSSFHKNVVLNLEH